MQSWRLSIAHGQGWLRGVPRGDIADKAWIVDMEGSRGRHPERQCGRRMASRCADVTVAPDSPQHATTGS